MPRLRTVPRQRRSQQSIDAILDAAERLVHEQGQVAFTANELATAAGMSIGRVYYWYPDIPAVVEALSRRAVNRFVALVAEIATDEAPDDASTLIRRSVETVCDFIDANPGAVALCLSGDPSTGPGHELNETLTGISAYLVQYAVPGLPSAEVAIVSEVAMAIVLGMLRTYLSAGDNKPHVRQELIYVLTAWLYCRFPPAEDRVWTTPEHPIRPSAASSPLTATRTPVYPAMVTRPTE